MHEEELPGIRRRGHGKDPEVAGGRELEVVREVQEDGEERNSEEEPECREVPFLQVQPFPEDEGPEDDGQGRVDEDVPGIHHGHRAQREGGEGHEGDLPGPAQPVPAREGDDEEEEEEHLVEDIEDMGMGIPPQEGEEGILVDGVRDNPGAVPEDSRGIAPEDEVPDEGGVDEDEGEEGEPFETGEEEVSDGVQVHRGEGKDGGEGQVEDDR